jgi:hypothetical protein
MNSTKSFFEEQHNLRYNFQTLKFVCSHNIQDDFIKKFTTENGIKESVLIVKGKKYFLNLIYNLYLIGIHL